MGELPAPIARAKGHPQIHDPRAILKTQREAQSSVQKSEIQLRTDLPQRVVALEARQAEFETKVMDRLEEIVSAIDRIENSTAHVEVKRGPGRPRKVVEEADAPEGA
jgi:hypothetical protein